MNHEISDFVIRIKNAALARRKTLLVPYSKTRNILAKILVEEGFLSAVAQETESGKKQLRLSISYDERIPVLTDVAIVSKPSLRIYVKSKNVRRTRSGFGTSILSTNKGIMSEKDANKKGVGGELLFRIW